MDGIFNVDDHFSVATEEVPLLSTLPSPEHVSTALDDFTTTFRELSDAFAATSAVVENLAATVSRVSTIFDGLEPRYKKESLKKKKEITNMIVQELYMVVVVVVAVVPRFLRASYVAVLAISQTPYSKGSYKNP